MKIRVITIAILLLPFHWVAAQTIDELRQGVEKILEGKSATVGVAIRGMHPQDTLSLNGAERLPMQSVFKYHIALAILHQVDQGKLALDQVVEIDEQLVALYKYSWSPIRKKYPKGGKLSVAAVLRYTVALSDNLGCDVLLDLLGGTEVLASYLYSIGIKEIAVIHTEISMQAAWENQYENWTTAIAANQALQLFFENRDDLLSNKSHQFLLDVLKGTETGKESIKGLLPEGTVVAHKTGYSGKNNKGVTGALNDIGIVFLPDGSYFYLSVFVSNSMESDETNQRIIAEIAKLGWDYFSAK